MWSLKSQSVAPVLSLCELTGCVNAGAFLSLTEPCCSYAEGVSGDVSNYLPGLL